MERPSLVLGSGTLSSGLSFELLKVPRSEGEGSARAGTLLVLVADADRSAREGGRLGPPPLFELRRVREPSKVAPERSDGGEATLPRR